MNFLKNLRVLAFGFVAVLMALVLPASARAGITNFGGVAVGDESLGTYLELTGVTKAWEPIPLSNMFVGPNGTTPLANTAITTYFYIGTLTTLTNTAGIIADVALGSAKLDALSIKYRIPWNYRSGGQLVAWCHTNTTFTAGALSVTADAYVATTDASLSLTTTAVAAGTAVQVSTTASSLPVPIVLTNSNATYYPGQWVTFKVTRAVTSSLAQLEFLGFDFYFRPNSVVNGR